jgi:hypothetical protein
MAKQQGYLFLDHRASPGLTPEEARVMGYDPKQVCEGKMLEVDTLTCAHCKTVVVPNPMRVRERGHCTKCMHYVCDVCAVKMTQPDYIHAPFAAKIERRDRLIHQVQQGIIRHG